MYVFSENDKVYVKNNSTPEMINNSSESNEEWFPINFQWKSLIELNKNMKLQHGIDENY
ncbi:hypothetical protein [Aquimarina longa]|uniref:hypothetical protein n=1 Tax=Aquimarina longa TaxID=1080221 RepID=UPI00130DB19B|nr:hypothetical protein [Aquimarina longa]